MPICIVLYFVHFGRLHKTIILPTVQIWYYKTDTSRIHQELVTYYMCLCRHYEPLLYMLNLLEISLVADYVLLSDKYISFTILMENLC